MKVGILIIGDELLSGKVDDLNTNFLMRRCHELGLEVARACILPDDVEVIAAELGRYHREFDLCITSGGLGPTHDDLTLAAVSLALNRPLALNTELLLAMEKHFAEGMTAQHKQMAYLPRGTELRWRDGASFPTTIVDRVLILPGSPKLMRNHFEGMAAEFSQAPYFIKRIWTKRREEDLAELMESLHDSHAGLKIGSYPDYDDEHYRVLITIESKTAALVDAAFEDLKNEIGPEAIWRVDES